MQLSSQVRFPVACLEKRHLINGLGEGCRGKASGEHATDFQEIAGLGSTADGRLVRSTGAEIDDFCSLLG